jgi:SM-20-related protein
VNAASAADLRIAMALAGAGWAQERAFLAPAAVAALARRLRQRAAGGEFRPAAVGAGAERQLRPDVRGDEIHWLVEPAGPVEEELLARFEQLRLALNRELMLGLHDFECHYARYAAGARYARHLDRSPRGAERVVSTVLYLNATWTAADAGELCLYAAEPVEIAPRGGLLVAFLSDRFEHEVRPAGRERLSLTGWFRRRGFASARV